VLVRWRVVDKFPDAKILDGEAREREPLGSAELHDRRHG
jgi:hypothetical protein